MKKSAKIHLTLLATIALSSCGEDNNQSQDQSSQGGQSATTSAVSTGYCGVYRGGGFFPIYYNSLNYNLGWYIGPKIYPSGMLGSDDDTHSFATRGGSYCHANTNAEVSESISHGGFGSHGESCGGESGC